ncbi:hypothetical protein [Streptomyces exfoliatus]|uniref:hypothetical protein n=1 Tax=Streptomyces exfoliatus TaxID=1905 RepID=UPI0037B6C04F
MNAHDRLAVALDHLGEDERAALVKDYRTTVLEEAAVVLEDTDDNRCGMSDCCGLHAEDFADIGRAMRAT